MLFSRDASNSDNCIKCPPTSVELLKVLWNCFFQDFHFVRFYSSCEITFYILFSLPDHVKLNTRRRSLQCHRYSSVTVLQTICRSPWIRQCVRVSVRLCYQHVQCHRSECLGFFVISCLTIRFCLNNLQLKTGYNEITTFAWFMNKLKTRPCSNDVCHLDCKQINNVFGDKLWWY